MEDPLGNAFGVRPMNDKRVGFDHELEARRIERSGIHNFVAPVPTVYS
jgi:hypothetical protein